MWLRRWDWKRGNEVTQRGRTARASQPGARTHALGTWGLSRVWWKGGEARGTGRGRGNGGPVCCGNRGEGGWGRPRPPASSSCCGPWACHLSRGGGAVGHGVTCRASPSGSLPQARPPGRTPAASSFTTGPLALDISPASMPQKARAAEAADKGAVRRVSATRSL